jgi:hypothetical protein
MAGLLTAAGCGLISIGLVLIGIIAYVAILRRSDTATAALVGTSLTRASHAAAGRVRLRGVVVPSEQGSLSEPLHGGPAVWFRLEAFHATSTQSTRGARWTPLFSLRDARDFGIDDGSGQIVRVLANEAGYVVPMDVFGGVHAAVAPDGLPWTRHEMTPRIESYLRSHEASGAEGANLKAHRSCLAVGETVTVVGWLDRSTGHPVLHAHPPESPLVVYGIEEETLREDRRVRLRNRILLTAAGIAMVVFGFLALAASMLMSLHFRIG